MTFLYPWLLLLLVVPILYAWRQWQLKGKQKYAWQMPIQSMHLPVSWRVPVAKNIPYIQSIAWALLILAVARPQTHLDQQSVEAEGIDIILAMDVSGSMLAKDFEPDRLEAAKKTAASFINHRPHDRIGLVVFAGESYLQCPLTSDHSVLSQLLANIQSGVINDGTAIGMGLASSVNHLRDSKAVSKVVILLTDGVENGGVISPETAIELANQFGIVVYTIGVGQKGMAPYPIQTPNGVIYQQVEVKIDEALLQKIAQSTKGKYFRATSNQDLAQVYSEIDEMEKSKIEVTHFANATDYFRPFLILGLLLLVGIYIFQFRFARNLIQL